MSAVLIGEKSGLDHEMKTIYQKCGISHLLAISGLHMTFLGMGIYNLFRKAGCGFAVSGITGGLLLIFYSLMIGAGRFKPACTDYVHRKDRSGDYRKRL